MPESGIYILTAPVQTGKTTSLVNWSAKRNDVFGILTPVVDGKRVFMNVYTKEQFPMEAVKGEMEVLTIGRFVFSKTNFKKAIQIILTATNNEGWLVIDEIGPMELKGEGFSDVLKEVLAKRNHNILLVVGDKDDMLEKVKAYFSIVETMELHGAEAIKKLPI